MATQIVIEPVAKFDQVTDYALEAAPLPEQIAWAFETLVELDDIQAAYEAHVYTVTDAGERTDISASLAERMADEWLENGAEYYEDDETWNAPAFARAHAENYLDSKFNENFADAQEDAKGADYYYGAPPRL